MIASEFGGGKYVTLVQCSGMVTAPPPLRIARPDAPLTVRGYGPEARIVRLLDKPHAYKTVYTCTVVVLVKVQVAAKKDKKDKKTTHAVHHARKVCEIVTAGTGTGGFEGRGCSRVVTLNTGFGGSAPKVAGHHPAG
jgi:hypothetical protein